MSPASNIYIKGSNLVVCLSTAQDLDSNPINLGDDGGDEDS